MARAGYPAEPGVGALPKAWYVWFRFRCTDGGTMGAELRDDGLEPLQGADDFGIGRTSGLGGARRTRPSVHGEQPWAAMRWRRQERGWSTRGTHLLTGVACPQTTWKGWRARGVQEAHMTWRMQTD